jgi:hypothetical protein
MATKTIRINAPSKRTQERRRRAAADERAKRVAAETHLAELSAGDPVRPVLTLVPSSEQLPDKVLDAGAKACFDAYAHEAFGQKTLFQSQDERIALWETKLKQAQSMLRRLRKGWKPSAVSAAEREPVPQVVPYEDQPQYIRTTWRRIAQRTHKAMERAK